MLDGFVQTQLAQLKNILRACASGRTRRDEIHSFLPIERMVCDDFFEVLQMVEAFEAKHAVAVFSDEIQAALARIEPLLLRVDECLHEQTDAELDEAWRIAGELVREILEEMGWAGEADWKKFRC